MESVLKTHNNKIEDAIENLRSLTVGDISAKNELQSLHSRISADCASIPGTQTVFCFYMEILYRIENIYLVLDQFRVTYQVVVHHCSRMPKMQSS